MTKVYMGQIMAECDCQHHGCKIRGYCMAEKITQLEQKLSEVEYRRVCWMNKSDDAGVKLSKALGAIKRASVQLDWCQAAREISKELDTTLFELEVK